MRVRHLMPAERARRALALVRAMHAAGWLGRDPEVALAVADLSEFVEATVSETEGVEMLAAERDRLAAELARERAAAAEYRARAEADRAAGLARVRELEARLAGVCGTCAGTCEYAGQRCLACEGTGRAA